MNRRDSERLLSYISADKVVEAGGGVLRKQGVRGGKISGKIAAAGMPRKQRTARAKKAATPVRWEKGTK